MPLDSKGPGRARASERGYSMVKPARCEAHAVLGVLAHVGVCLANLFD
jgi:hypothetical protein